MYTCPVVVGYPGNYYSYRSTYYAPPTYAVPESTYYDDRIAQVPVYPPGGWSEPTPSTAQTYPGYPTQPAEAWRDPSALRDEQDPSRDMDQAFVRLQQMMLEGTQLFASGEYEEATALFQQVAREDPNNADAFLAYASARFATGDYAQAARAVQEGITLFPDIVDSAFDLRDRYGDPCDFDRQLALLEAWVRRQPDDVDALVVLGFVHHFTGRRDVAADVFLRVARHGQAHAQLADIFLSAAPLEQIRPEAGLGR